jgi:peroxiredoxin
MISSKKRSREIIFLFWFGMILVFVSAQIRAHEDPWKGLSVIRVSGYSPPDFTLPTLDGGSITLSDLKGKVVLINFWTTWCPPCREEMPSLEKLYRHFKHEKFTLLAVDNLSFPILLDKAGDVSAKYGANAIPTTYIIDKKGKAVGKAVGPRKWNGDHAKAIIEELLKE